MRDTTLTIQRPEGTVIAQHLYVQVDQATTKDVIDHRMAYSWHGADLFKITTFDWYPTALLQRGDVLYDERATDPETGTAFKYRVVGRVKDYPGDHQEVTAEVVVGG